MKRMTILCLSFLAFYYWLSPEEKAVSEIDIVEIKQSATKRALPETSPVKLAPPPVEITAGRTISDGLDYLEDQIAEEARVAEPPEADDHYYEDEEIVHQEELPWDEMRAGWRSELKDMLFELDPVNGESIYSAYQAETNAYESELENLAQTQSDEADYLMGELEARHHEKLRQIFGPYYRDVTDQHSVYNSSLRQIYRAPDNSYAAGVAL